jgi:hypothetical protein
MRTLALALVPALLAAPGAAIACSVTADYRVPTNLELAAQANAIVLGQVVGAAEAQAEPGEARSAAIEVRPLAALKGLMPGETLLLPGMALASPGAPARTTPARSISPSRTPKHALARASAAHSRRAPRSCSSSRARTAGGRRPGARSAAGPRTSPAPTIPGSSSPRSTPGPRASRPPSAKRCSRTSSRRFRRASTPNLTTIPRCWRWPPTSSARWPPPGFPELAGRPPEPATPRPGAPTEELGELGTEIDALGGEAADR